MKKVSMIGVGKLGQDCAEVMSGYYDVVGYDIEPRTPSFPMKDTIEAAVYDRDIIFIAAPTGHDPIYGGEIPTSHLPNKDFDYSIVTNILTEVNNYVNKSQLVVLISTVLPGTVRNILKPCITNARFIYNPYLIAMGTIKWDMVNPEMIIIGTEDGSITGDAKELINFYKAFMQNDPRYEVGTWDEAESIKIFYNTFISTKLALVNMIQDVAEANGNINVDVVSGALARSNYRITGPAYMKAGMGDAGACHPRDNIALRHLAERLELGYDLFDSIMRAREVQAERMAKTCLEYGRQICIIGKSYKPGVPYTNGSYSLLVGHYIEKHNGMVSYVDKHTGDTANLFEQEVYLIGYWEDWVTEVFNLDTINHNAVLIDPWRAATDDLFQGQIIHYGNTRSESKKKVSRQHRDLERNLLEIFPELTQYRDRLHIIFAGPSSSFHDRSVVAIAHEIDVMAKNGRDLVFFYDLSEPTRILAILKIHQILDKVKNSSSTFYYSTLTLEASEIYKNLCLTHDLIPRLNIIISNIYVSVTKNSVDPGEYQIAVKPKQFLCFNKNHRLHRLALLSKILSKGLLEKAFYSMYGSWVDPEWFEDSIEFLENIDSTLKFSLIENKHIFPLHLNADIDHRNNPLDISQDDLYYFKNSYYSLVTETVFYKDRVDPLSWNYGYGIAYTEKTYKPIAAKHPFIIVAADNSLKELRNLGFKTFSPYIDESYDDEQDDKKRLDMIVEEVVRLSQFTDEQWIEWQINIKDIIEHNYNVYKNMTDLRITKNIPIPEAPIGF